LSARKKILVGTETVTTPRVYVKFRDGRYHTDNPDIIERLDELIDNGWHRRLHKMTDKAVMERIKASTKKAHEAQAKVFAEANISKTDKAKYTKFNEFMKSRKTPGQPKVVQGMRDVEK